MCIFCVSEQETTGAEGVAFIRLPDFSTLPLFRCRKMVTIDCTEPPLYELFQYPGNRKYFTIIVDYYWLRWGLDGNVQIGRGLTAGTPHDCFLVLTSYSLRHVGGTFKDRHQD